MYGQQYLEKFLGPSHKAPLSIWKDVQNIWYREPSFPASVRVILCTFLISVFVLPLMMLLLPPLVTLITGYLLLAGEVPNFDWLELPLLEASEKKNLCKVVKDLIRKGMLRISVFVTLSDYIQTFRALGVIHL